MQPPEVRKTTIISLQAEPLSKHASLQGEHAEHFPPVYLKTYSMLWTSCNANLCTIPVTSCMLPRLTATRRDVSGGFGGMKTSPTICVGR